MTWSRDHAEAALFAHIQVHAVPILSAAVRGVPIAAPQVPALKAAPYIVSAFILDLADHDREAFTQLETYVKGAMLASVLFYPEIGNAQRRFERVRAYLDTPLLLRAIGAHGKVAEDLARQTIELGYELGVQPMCFESTFQETLGVLNGAARALRRYGTYSLDPSETVEYLLEAGYQASDVELMISRLDRVVESLRIEVEPRPAHSAALAVDEAKLEAALQAEINYRNPDALKHDLDAITAIHRLRGGELTRSFERARAVFVTTNASLAHIARVFFEEHYGGSGVPICFPAHHFGTLMWLKKPSAAPDLPRELLIASCFAALNPADSLWQRYLTEIDKLRARGDISSEDFYLLRFDLTSKSALLAITAGSSDAFVEGSVPEILNRARAHAAREALEGEQRAVLRAEHAESETAHLGIQAEQDREARFVKYRLFGNRMGLWVRRAILSMGFVVGVILAAATLTSTPTLWPLLLLSILSIAASAAAVFNWSVAQWFRGFAAAAEIWVSNAVVRLLASWLERVS